MAAGSTNEVDLLEMILIDTSTVQCRALGTGMAFTQKHETKHEGHALIHTTSWTCTHTHHFMDINKGYRLTHQNC